jgi:hypothetical protein
VATFLEMATKIATDLRRSNILPDIKAAINDAIAEGAKNASTSTRCTRRFPRLPVQSTIADLGLVEIDAAWYLHRRFSVQCRYHQSAGRLMFSPAAISSNGPLQEISRYGGQLRFYPIPSSIFTVYP